ncbi:phospho-N-acetylmuramoyl-pentapeptide-transferase [Candidatus Saccharibacteria bacterium]|nr:phospho-N-acetylmuramoyl-pentapeptide-transferase [Candidatus Saccharibacteria bacterium]
MQFDQFTLALLPVLGFSFAGFSLAMLATPIFTTLAYRYQWWRKQRATAVTGESAKVFAKLHAEKHKRHIPTMAGTIVLFAVILITAFANLSRNETWLPLATLVLFGGLGLIDDLSNIMGFANRSGGLKAKTQALALVGLSLIGAWWFYAKLGYSVLHVPAVGDFEIGWLYVPLFIAVVFSTAKSVSITDGLDGLAGGLLSIAFSCFAIIAFFSGLNALAIFCATIVGALLAYTWFNIYPARFFMGQVGSTALGATLGVIAMLLNSVFVLPIIGFVFVLEAGSSAVQIFSKKVFHRKIFLSAPLHHHLEASGWPETKVTMRLWIIGAVVGMLGLLIGLIARG